jgi:hypothetical protein
MRTRANICPRSVRDSGPPWATPRWGASAAAACSGASRLLRTDRLAVKCPLKRGLQEGAVAVPWTDPTGDVAHGIDGAIALVLAAKVPRLDSLSSLICC